jgi:NADH-ubiquinone oxidoreductase chain 4
LGIFYTSLSTIRQIDLKKIIAYASVGHMSYVILGLFSYNLQGLIGSIYLMISHGLVSSGLFFLVGILYDRYKTRLLRYYSGLVQIMPLFIFFFFFINIS